MSFSTKFVLDHTPIAHIYADPHFDQQVVVGGILRAVREQKGRTFVTLYDGSPQTIQLVIPDGVECDEVVTSRRIDVTDAATAAATDAATDAATAAATTTVADAATAATTAATDATTTAATTAITDPATDAATAAVADADKVSKSAMKKAAKAAKVAATKASTAASRAAELKAQADRAARARATKPYILSVRAAIKAVCIIRKPPTTSLEIVELEVVRLLFVGEVFEPIAYPFAVPEATYTPAHYFAHPDTRQAIEKYTCITDVTDRMAASVHEFFRRLGFKWIHTPILTASDCEGAGEVFRVTTLLGDDVRDTPTLPDSTKVDVSKELLCTKAGLTVSGQLHGETAAVVHQKIYTFGPTFRAEPSHTSRHLAEFWMIEPELTFVTLDQLISLAEDLIRTLIADVLRYCPRQIDALDAIRRRHAAVGDVPTVALREQLKSVVDTDFVRIRYSDAWAMLKEHVDTEKVTFVVPLTPEMDFQSEHERYLCRILGDKFVAVTHYPAAIKAFYMQKDPTDPTKVQSFDILGPIEFVGGSIRKYRPDALIETMTERGMSFGELDYYIKMRETGTMPHGGFGLGFARLVAWVCGLSSIHDVPQFPRAAGGCRF